LTLSIVTILVTMIVGYHISQLVTIYNQLNDVFGGRPAAVSPAAGAAAAGPWDPTFGMNLRRQILGIRGIPSQGSHGQMMK